MESVIGYRVDDSAIRILASEELLDMLIKLANDRFRDNAMRIERFKANLCVHCKSVRSGLVATDGPQPVADFGTHGIGSKNNNWEDATARRERKKAEGLERQANLVKQPKGPTSANGDIFVTLDHE